ncbi:hypothetical protein ACRYCC_20185 [Actinomadura scrupuli]|uniref:hypothetical protein n=1 Tax=Actinomadura scrupuli TaxID=559629 RepID=UPI003D98005D
MSWDEDYKRQVLEPARDAGDQPPEDLRVRYRLPDRLDPAEVAARVKQVRQCWRRARGQLKYRKLIDRLEAEHRELAPVFAAAEKGDLGPLTARLRGGDERTARRRADARSRLLDAAGATGMLTPAELEGIARSSGVGGTDLAGLAAAEGVDVREPDVLPVTPPYAGYPKARESLDVLGHRHLAEFLFGGRPAGPIRVLGGFHAPGVRVDSATVSRVAAEWARRPRDTSSTNADTVLIALRGSDLDELIRYDMVERLRERHRQRASARALMAFAVENLGIAIAEARRLVFAVCREGGPAGGPGGRLRELLDAGEVYAAAELAATAEIDPDGDAAVLAAEARQRVATAVRLRDEALGERDSEAAWRLLADALHLVPDLPGAEEHQRRLTPLPVPSLEAVPAGDTVRLIWPVTPSTAGTIAYRVVRLAGADGAVTEQVVTETTDTSVYDEEPPVNVPLRYQVLACRGEAVSAPVAAGPVLVRPEPSGVELTAGDGAVRGRWTCPREAARVLVTRSDGRPGPPPASIPADRLGCVDTSVHNGTTYHYLIRAVYLDEHGREEPTPGVRVSATPTAPPDPVAAFTIEPEPLDPGRLLIAFDAPRHGTAEVVMLPGPPPWPYGALVPAADVRSAARPLAASPAARGVVVRPRGNGVLLVVTVTGTSAVIGAHRRHMNLPAPRGLSVQRRGGTVHVGFDWPPDVAEMEVSCRAGTGEAQRVTVTRAGYDAQGGVRMPAPEDEPVEVSVAARAGALAGSPASTTVAGRAVVEYDLDRGGPPWSRTVTVALRAPRPVRLSRLVLVLRAGRVMPQRPEDGETLVTWTDLDITGMTRLTVPQPKRSGPYWLRCFAGDESLDLIDPPVRRLQS